MKTASAHNAVPSVLSARSESCPNCNGIGKRLDDMDQKECHICSGTGRVPAKPDAEPYVRAGICDCDKCRKGKGLPLNNTKPDAVEYEMTDEDAANVGRALMQTIRVNRPGYVWSVCPSEIVTDLMNDAGDLLTAYKALYRAYVQTLEAGCDRLATFGCKCDPVDVMERGDPALIRARAVISEASK